MGRIGIKFGWRCTAICVIFLANRFQNPVSPRILLADGVNSNLKPFSRDVEEGSMLEDDIVKIKALGLHGA